MGKQYPHDVLDKMREQGLDVLAIDAASIAEKLGNVRATNILLLGAISSKLDFTEKTWKEAIKSRVPKKHIELNLKAFDEGRKLGQGAGQA